MKALLKSLNINEKLTKPRTNKQKIFNHVKDNIPLIEDYNFMADLLELPTTKEGFKYLFVIVDLASDEFDFEPLKNKNSQTVLDAMLKLFKSGKYIKKPYASIRTDAGSEFKSVFNKWLYDNDILHKVALPQRHTQLSNVDSLIKLLGRLFNGYMNEKERATGKVYREWTDILNIVKTALNKARKKKLDIVLNPNKYPAFDFEKAGIPKFKVGQMVHYKLDVPYNALGHKQPTYQFRAGDYRYSKNAVKIVKILYMNGFPWYRYLLDGISNASYSDYQLIPSTQKVSRYNVKKIIGYKNVGNKREFLVWWSGFKKKEATYEPEANLRKDGLGDWIDEFLENN